MNQISFATLIGLAFTKGISGSLQVEKNKIRKDIYFLRGIPVCAKSDLAAESLRQLLFKNGKIDRSTLEIIEKKIDKSRVDEDKVLLNMKIIDDSSRYHHLQTLASKRILSCFQWSSGRYKYNPGEFFLNYIDLFDIPPLDLIHEGISTYYGLALAEEIQKVSDSEIEINGDLREIEAFLSRYHPTSNLNALLGGPSMVARALPKISPDINDALTLLYVLIVSGRLSLDGHLPGDCAPDVDEPYEEGGEADSRGVSGADKSILAQAISSRNGEDLTKTSQARLKKYPPREKGVKPLKPPTPPKRFRKKKLRAYGEAAPTKPAPKLKTTEPVDHALLSRFRKMAEKVDGNDYYEILGVIVDAPIGEIKKAYFLKNQQYHADRARSLGPEGLALSQKITDALHNANQTLTDVDKRFKWEMNRFLKDELAKAWSIELKHKLARTQFKRGKWYLAKRRPDYAFRFFDSAVKLDAEQAPYYACMGWSQYASDKTAAVEAKAFIKTGLGIDKNNADALFFMAWIEKDLENPDAAQEFLQRTLEAHPDHVWARAELEKTAAEKKKSEGFFGRLLKK